MPFYSRGLGVLAFESTWGWGWPCFDTNLLPSLMWILLKNASYLNSNMIHIIKPEGLYQNKVNSSLVFNRNCKMGYCFWNRYWGRIVQLWESLSFTYTANVGFKLRISQNWRWADRNSSKQFLWIKNCVKLNLCVEIMNSKRQVNGKLGHMVQIRVCPFDVNVMLNPEVCAKVNSTQFPCGGKCNLNCWKNGSPLIIACALFRLSKSPSFFSWLVMPF